MRARYLLLVLLLLPACATRTEMVNMWVDPDNPKEPLKKLLVVALSEDLETRQVWEEGFAQSLAQNDVNVVPSYVVAPYISPDSLDILGACGRAGCEGFMVILHHQPETRTVYMPGYATTTVRKYVPIKLYMDSLCQKDKWLPAPPPPAEEVIEIREEHHPGWEYQEVMQRCDVDVWALDGDLMVWTGTTDVFDPISDQHAAYKISDTVVFELSRCGIVPAGL